MDCVAVVAFFEMRRLREALRRAGFDICEHRPLIRFKAEHGGRAA
jgi:hypothetical protein